MRKNRLPTIALLIIFLLASSSCDFSSSESETDDIALSGTVRYMEIEGGFFAIRGDDGTTYDPINLAPAFRIDGLRVHIVAIIRRDLAGIHMVGPIIEIITIVRE